MTNTLALITDGKARLIRPRTGRGKGAPTEVFVQFLVPDGADDDIVTRLTFGITEAYADAEQAIAARDIAEAATAAAPAPAPEPTGGKRPGRKKGGTILPAKDVVDYLFERGADSIETGVSEDDIVQRFADRADADTVRSRVRSISSPSHGHMHWAYHPSDDAPDRVKLHWLTEESIAKFRQLAPQPVVTHDHMALADGGVPWGGTPSVD